MHAEEKMDEYYLVIIFGNSCFMFNRRTENQVTMRRVAVYLDVYLK